MSEYRSNTKGGLSPGAPMCPMTIFSVKRVGAKELQHVEPSIAVPCPSRRRPQADIDRPRHSQLWPQASKDPFTHPYTYRVSHQLAQKGRTGRTNVVTLPSPLQFESMKEDAFDVSHPLEQSFAHMIPGTFSSLVSCLSLPLRVMLVIADL